MECTAAIEPRRYSTSSVMATWTKEGSQTFVWAETEAHSWALRKGRVFRKENRLEDRIASDWKEGERMIRAMTNIAAEKNPENLVIGNIFIFCLLVFAPSSSRVQVARSEANWERRIIHAERC